MRGQAGRSRGGSGVWPFLVRTLHRPTSQPGHSIRLALGMDDTPARRPSSRYAWYVVGVLTLANISANVDQYILTLLVAPIKRDLGISDTQMSLLTGLAFTTFYALLGFPIARLADRTSRRNIMAGGIALWSMFTSLCA